MNKFVCSLKNFASSKLAALAVVLGAGLAFAKSSFAAVDADVASTTASIVTTLKENISGVITANIANIVIVGVLVFSILFIWRLAKRFMSGR